MCNNPCKQKLYSSFKCNCLFYHKSIFHQINEITQFWDALFNLKWFHQNIISHKSFLDILTSLNLHEYHQQKCVHAINIFKICLSNSDLWFYDECRAIYHQRGSVHDPRKFPTRKACDWKYQRTRVGKQKEKSCCWKWSIH